MQLARYSLMFLIFLAKKVSDKMKNMPEGFISLAQPLGWMTQENFLIALKHLHSQVKCTKQKPILLIMENHISHMGCSICVFAKENSIILQTLPPHTSLFISTIEQNNLWFI
jgi:hypothetical protein